MTDTKNTVSDERLAEIDYPANIATLAEVRSMARELQSLRASSSSENAAAAPLARQR